MPKVMIIMGVSGCGKTTIGKQLSKELNIPFYDGDDFHPKANIDKMKNKRSLTDEDRLPWLQILSDNINEFKKVGYYHNSGKLAIHLLFYNFKWANRQVFFGI